MGKDKTLDGMKSMSASSGSVNPRLKVKEFTYEVVINGLVLLSATSPR